MKPNPRSIVLDALMRVEENDAYSNIVLGSALRDSGLSGRDRAFAAMLFYGVLERKLLLDYNLSRFSSRSVTKLDPEVLMILRMGLYQLRFMDSVPDRAAVNEAVALCKSKGLHSASGYVNGVLRAAAGTEEILLPEKRKSKNKYLSVKYSCPEKIIKLWRSAYGDDITLRILSGLEGRPPVCARVNTLRTTSEELGARLSDEGISVRSSELVPDCLFLEKTGAIEETKSYREGLFHIQDSASQICCGILSPEEGQTVTDVCSAPGGKSFTIAQLMRNRGRIVSCDLYEHRLGLVKEGAERLGIDIIETMAADSSTEKGFPLSDRILCDVPCSGLGIIRRKPELRYKEDHGLRELPEIQYSILKNCASALKPGGLLVYSTCTLNPEENSGVIRRFLAEMPEFEACPIKLPPGVTRIIGEEENELTLFPAPDSTDGFFISLCRRKK